MTKVRYKTEQEIIRDNELYGIGEVSYKYYLCDRCNERSEVKLNDGGHLCLAHALEGDE